MKMLCQWMVVKFDRPRETKLGSGLIAVPANTNLGSKVESTERLKGEWWPEIGTVLCPPQCHRAMRPSKETVSTSDGREVVKQEHYYPAWRVPKRGDMVVFGFKDVNVDSLDSKGRVVIDAAKAGYVIPRDGSSPYALGEWVVLEQIPKTIYSGQFVATFTQEYVSGIGVVRMAGDGFMEKHPSVSPGKIIRYMSVGNKNPECPNHIDSYLMSRVKAPLVTGIDHNGIDEAELERLKNEVSELSSMTGELKQSVRSFESGTAIPIKPGMSELEIAQIREHNSKIHRERSAESRDLAFAAAAKQQEKKLLGSNRKFF